ncbi:stage II sporulation protein P [Carboxydothermus pertinax]|uniref:Stage II sporulation protein P n=1 Tax=Carboxydothermus pertinax TaxID=870242 RepID=A0A1L8CTQ6_9THEO|nr:stage II sporulation protein P [Carboxydothermus pertinax]GAV22301.1 stage II sporulation protein P [Carboxydothermus pertinax]
MKKKINNLIIYIILALIFLFPLPVYAERYYTADIKEQISDHSGSFYVTIYDEQGRVIDKMARQVEVGDELIAEDDHHYKIIRVNHDRAYARDLGKDQTLVGYKEYFDRVVLPAGTTPAKKGTVAIYHTHTDEAYAPSDGKANIPARGGIYKVGAALADKLSRMGIKVNYDRTPHDPHDANAYHRSRRTAVRLMKKRPIAMLDVHRDAVPDPDFYEKNIQGQKVTKIRLVVGRQNPQMAANLDFARKMKAYVDKTHPGLVKGIFIGKGNYNQDLMPTALLLEVGTHTNRRSEAEKGVQMFADAVPKVLGITTSIPGARGTPGGVRSDIAKTPGAWRNFFIVLIAALILGGAFLLISTGSLAGAKERLGSFISREVTSTIAPRNKEKKEDQGENK